MIKRKLFIILCFSLIWSSLFGQSNPKDSLLSLLEHSDGEERIMALMRLAQVTATSDPSGSLDFSQEALILSREFDDPLLIANALNGVAISYYYLGDQQQSLNYLLQSIDQMKVASREDTSNLELVYRLAVFSSNAGNVYQGMAQHDKALELFLQAEVFLEELLFRDPENQRYLSMYIKCMNNKAPVYQDLRETGKAEATLHEALNRSREAEYLPGISMCLNNLGLIEIEKKDYQQALSSYTEALKINLQLKDSIAIAGTYNNIGLIYEETSSFMKALEYYKLSLYISERLKYLFGISNTSVNIGKIYGILHQFDSAKVYLDRGLAAALQGDMLQLQQQSYRHLAAMYLLDGKYQKALMAYQEYASIKDSIFTIERSKQIADMETKYETEKKVRENELLRKDLELRKTTQRLLFIAISALVV
ncbi:MAG: tetratricopeptide repeat protein, partial [Bacteroidales bacterium]|nr:tetratricopeptide repeat protein [Bacteroidales bacterium]